MFIYNMFFCCHSRKWRDERSEETCNAKSLGRSEPNDGIIWVEKITAKNVSVSCSHEMWALRAFSEGFLDRGRKLVRDLYRRG